MKVKLIEMRVDKGIYDLDCQKMIIEHEKHGRLLITEAFGGTDSLEGGCYRWKHGMAIKIKENDTFESLFAGEWNEGTSLISAVYGGYDKARPILEWDGHIITAVAKKALSS